MEEMVEERISNMDALLFATVLEVALLQIRVQEGSTALRSRFWKCTSKVEKAQFSKLESDRQLLRDVLRVTLVQVVDGRWGALAAAAQALGRRRASAAAALRLTHDQLSQTREKLTDDLNFKRHRWEEDLLRADHEIAYLRDKLKDDLLNASTRLRYASRWLGARADALELRCQWRGPPAPDQRHEARVHHELARAFQLQIEERERYLEYWRIRYSDDTAAINARLADVRDLYVEAIGRSQELQSLYDLHDGEMRGWLTFKRERAARLEREERQRTAATMVQAWWRGQMVRRALGQFKYLRSVKKPAAKSKKK